MEVAIHISYNIADTKDNSKKADELYLEFDKRFKEVFPKGKLEFTYIKKCKKKG